MRWLTQQYLRLWNYFVQLDRARILEQTAKHTRDQAKPAISKPSIGLTIVTDLPTRKGLRIKHKKDSQ